MSDQTICTSCFQRVCSCGKFLTDKPEPMTAPVNSLAAIRTDWKTATQELPPFICEARNHAVAAEHRLKRDVLEVVGTLLAQVERSEQEKELHNIQLAAISTASLQNTRESFADGINRDNPYWTVAYADVRVAIQREIQQRERAEAAEQAVKSWRTWAQFVYGGGGPIAGTDEQLQQRVCEFHDREVVPAIERANAAEQARDAARAALERVAVKMRSPDNRLLNLVAGPILDQWANELEAFLDPAPAAEGDDTGDGGDPL